MAALVAALLTAKGLNKNKGSQMTGKDSPKICFIGLGIMGKPMAANLLKAGYRLTVFNRTRKKMASLMEAGAQAAVSVAECARDGDFIFTMLPDSPEVEAVILGEDGVAVSASPGAVVVDMSSVSPLTSQKVAEALQKRGIEFLDAPVSGGEPGAKAGTLAIMVGGKEKVFEQAEPILRVMGKTVTRVGDVGAGNYAKLANQIIVALNIAAVGEAFVLAQKAGLDPEKLYLAIKDGLAGSHVLDAKAPLIMSRQFEPGFKIRLHQKDLKNVLETARATQVPLPLTALVQQMLTALVAEGKGELDHGALVQFVEKISGVEIRKD